MPSLDNLKTATKTLVILCAGLIALELTFLPMAADWQDYSGIFATILVLSSIIWAIFNEPKIRKVFSKKGVTYWSVLTLLLIVAFALKNITTIEKIVEQF
jgi:hypothetical protein